MPLVSPNPNFRPAGSEGGREFASTDHLAADAIVAYVDGELKMSAHLRAARHLESCQGCAAKVSAQHAAREALRGSGEIKVPGHLLGELTSIPTREFDVRDVAKRRANEESAEPGPEAAERARRGFLGRRRK